MSEHAEHGTRDSHGGGHGHDEEGWGDYNARAPKPSNLPPVNALSLAIFGLSLALLLYALVLSSFRLSIAKPDTHEEKRAETATHADHEH
jgi:hypothetical protein